MATSENAGLSWPINPMLYPEDGEVLGVLEGTGKAGLAVKKFENWTSIYSSAGNLPPALLRGIAEYAGLPVVNAFDGDVTYVNDRLVAVHTVAGGERQLNFGPKVTKGARTDPGDRVACDGRTSRRQARSAFNLSFPDRIDNLAAPQRFDAAVPARPAGVIQTLLYHDMRTGGKRAAQSRSDFRKMAMDAIVCCGQGKERRPV